MKILSTLKFFSTKALFIGVISYSLITNFACNSKPQSTKANSSFNQETLTVFAAISLSQVVKALTDTFSVKHNIKFILNFGSSGTLARQIEQGEIPDIYISANKKWANFIGNYLQIEEIDRQVVAGNTLVLVSPKQSSFKRIELDSTFNLTPFLENKQISIGNPKYVPAGMYAKQALEFYGVYSKTTKRLLSTVDVRAALKLVEIKEVDFGLVYKTDALLSDKVKIIASFPNYSHNPIVYVSSICSKKETAHVFQNFLNSDMAEGIWIKHGFNK